MTVYDGARWPVLCLAVWCAARAWRFYAFVNVLISCTNKLVTVLIVKYPKLSFRAPYSRTYIREWDRCATFSA